jgi:N-acylneuraminate cytidylyltransferase
MSDKICIIPARGGSKRIPRKNVKVFLGKPIISYAIDLAKSTNMFDEIMVSTDDREIADIAIAYGAKVPFLRSHKNSNDFATTNDVLIEVLHEYAKIGKSFNSLLSLYPTSVLSRVSDILNGYNELNNYDIVLPVTKFSYPPQRSFKVGDGGKLEYRFEEFVFSRSQDLEPWYHDAGQWCWYRLNRGRINERNVDRGFIELEPSLVQDIDTMDDWKLAEIKYNS